MRILGIESSCDETACSVVVDGRRVLSSVIATQDELHERFGGVVPEVAARRHLETMLPVMREALEGAGVALDEIDAIATVNQPGLIGSLLVGLTAAKTLAAIHHKPLVALNHLHCHLYADCLYDGDEAEAGEPVAFPFVGMVVSGGHTSLMRVRAWDDIEPLGGTIDDAAGEAFDKVAQILELGYPGGPAIDRAARTGDPMAFKFPRSLLGDDSLDFSFSGLKTAVLYTVRGHGRREGLGELTDKLKADLAASFQEAVVDVLAGKALKALETTGIRELAMGGGVIANGRLREVLEAEAADRGVRLHIPERRYCTDNAAMVAGLGYHYARAERFTPIGVDAVPT